LTNQKPVTVSVIIPCFNEEKTIGLLLDAIYVQTYPLSAMEVIIADGKSTDRTRDVVREFRQSHPELLINLVENPRRIIPAGLNTAIAHAQGEIILRLDAHSAPAKDYVERCVRRLESGDGDNVGGVWDIQPGKSNWVGRSIAAAASHPLGVGDAQYRHSKHAAEVDTVPFGSFYRSLVDKIGGFDESLLTNEDYEFNARVRLSGGRIYLDPQIRSHYYARPDLKSLAHQYFRYGFWKYKMLKRYPRTLRWRQALPPLFVSGVISLGILSVFFVWVRILLIIGMSLYLVLISLGAILTAIRRTDALLIVGIPLAIMVMHFCWGSGFLYSILRSKG
jgi:succinoglycan biosynthesis protein ExoA